MAQKIRKNPSPCLSKGGPLKATYHFTTPVSRQYNLYSKQNESKSGSKKSSKTLQKTQSWKVERSKPVRASQSAVGQIRRTASLDAITGNYLTGQWPRLTPAVIGNQRQQDKCTQFPEGVALQDKLGHKRSASVDDGDVSVKDVKERLKQTRTRASKSMSVGFQRHSPVCGLLRAVHGAGRAAPVSRTRGSVESLNAEIADLDLCEMGCVMQQCEERPAPPPPRSCSARSADKQTPRLCDSCGSSPGLSRPSSLTDTSPRVMESKGTLTTNTEERPEVEAREGGLEPSSPGMFKVSSSPRPNKSYRLTRQPPDGCEKVAADELRGPPPMKDYLLEPRNDFKPSQNSAFVPLKGPITAQQAEAKHG